MALELDPRSVGLSPSSGGSVWGVVMDTAMPSGHWNAVVVIADGTTSLYTGAAFGIIGAGTHESVRRASAALLAAVEANPGLFVEDPDTATPPAGEVFMRALTWSGRRRLRATEEGLASGTHPASPLFYAAQDVITQLRLIYESQH